MFEPIAIVGRSCVLPGTFTPAGLWDAVVAGRDLLASAPEGRWGLSRATALTHDPSRSEDRAWSDRGGYVSGFEDAFRRELSRDPFARDADDLLALDPLFHWVLHCGREALREAGHDGRTNPRVSAVLGNLSFPSSAMSRYAEHVWLARAPVDPRNRFMSGFPALILADELGLGAGAFALDAACASSLYAIKLACDQLHDRAVDVALAGAVCRSDDLFIHVGFCALDAMSRTGRSRPFHAEADGLVPGEGCAVVALKRLSDAVAARDHIHGVIRGIGLSNDGRGRGLLAPDSGGQSRALRTAWGHSGLDPDRLGLVECHATGTPVGDATELRTLHAVFGQHEGLPLGSLKSNLGHVITAAGAAALIKVLGAFDAETRPPTLHASPVNPALAETPFRLVTQAEPWVSDRPRVAGINAFGFGGNNGHLIVEQYDGAPASAAPAPRPTPPEVVVVGLGVRGPGLGCAADLQDALHDGRARGRTLTDVVLPLEGMRFPPRDLEQTLAQQLAVLAAAMEAVDDHLLPAERTAVLIGSQSDPEVCRYGARWRLADWYADRGPEWVAEARDAVTPVLRSAGVVGNMPNIPANRIGSQLDLGGPGFTIAAEQNSGLRSLLIALRMLQTHEVDVALAGAVDLSAEPVHAAAAASVLAEATPGDAAVVLALKRRADAERDGDTVLAAVGTDDAPPHALVFGPDALDLASQFGRSHAAHSLLHVAAAVVSCASAKRPRVGQPAVAWDGPRTALVRSVDMVGDGLQVVVRATADRPQRVTRPPAPARPLTFPAHPQEIRMPSHPDSTDGADRMDPAPGLPPTSDTAAPAIAGPTGFETPPGDTMAPAPGLTWLHRPAPAMPASPGPVAAPRPLPAPAPALAPPDAPPLGSTPSSGLAQLASFHRRLSDAHQAFLAQQHAVHARFLEVQVRAQHTMAQAVAHRRAGRPLAPPPARAPELAGLHATTAASPVTTPPAPPAAAPAPVPPRPTPAPEQRTRPAAHGPRPGPKFDRKQLEQLASDKISTVLGEMFAVQDAFPRQVRMPQPPLLLADRVTGIDAEPGSMTTGVIWTETDVTWDAWYLHDGTMPAGAMIEAGQADLLLISYLGADFRNRGERVYRLLGCQLIYDGGLPRPGETLHYEIHIDGHANVGDTAIFFFHYDCTDDRGGPRLTVREGQAGFFTDEELAESGGILWDAQTGEHAATARLDPPRIESTRTSFTEAQVLAFANGDGFACFGPGFEKLQTHVRTPRMAPPPMSFWQRVTHLTNDGGPWQRGYFRAEQDITPDDWFFQGHFKDDPCMPGTMMFEACLQAAGFMLAARGYTVDHDGWTFEPVPGVPYDLRCRGQVIPSSRLLIYEVFVEEVHDGPWPTIFADFLCTIDGLKAFHARRVGVRLRPDWPLTSRPHLLADHVEPEPVATIDGFEFGYASLLACAWGLPSDAFGPLYRPFDEGRHCARLPGPPYHFMSRVTKIDGPIGGMQVGTAIELSYDIPPDAWYFDENGHRTMPFCVLLEAALQPCGWIASFVGSALTTDQDLFFRNLDGTARWTAECLPDSGTLRTAATITSISQSGGMIIEAFEVRCFLGDTQIYEMDTVFGFFPGESFANQTGIVPSDEERAALNAACDYLVDLTERPARYCDGALRLPEPMLLMLDRVTGYWPDGGKAGLGRLRSEKDVDPGEWFFKAHFFSDPVQPGSLGLEAMLQLMQFFMIERNLHEGMDAPRFEPLMLDHEIGWKYRGQVTPKNRLIRCEVEITEVSRDDKGPYVLADAYLWVDELRIYQGVQFGMRVVEGGSPPPPRRVIEPREFPSDDPPPPPLTEEVQAPTEATLDPEVDTWVRDHCPTYTIPALPGLTMVDQLAGCALRRSGGVVVEVRDVQILGWVKVGAPVRLRPVVVHSTANQHDVALEVWRDKPDPRLSRFEPAARGTVITAHRHGPAPAPWPALAGTSASDPYERGALFHGPAFRYLTELVPGAGTAMAHLDATAGSVPHGTLGQGLLDALLHAIPHDDLHGWDPTIGRDQAAYPQHIQSLRLYGPTPRHRVRVIARYGGRVPGPNGHSLPRITVQAVDLELQRVWAELDLLEILLPKGPIGRAPGSKRMAFLRDQVAVPGLGLSSVDGSVTTVKEADIKASDWLPGTVAAVYAATNVALATQVAVGDHVARHADVHPGTVNYADGVAISEAAPLTRWPVRVSKVSGSVSVRNDGDPTLHLEPVQRYWDRFFGLGRWPVEDVYYSLIRRFVRRAHVVDPAAHAAIHGRSVLYAANHQVGVESLWFSIVASGLQGVNTVTLAKAEHRTTWLGRLIKHCFSYPGAQDPEVITFFDRDIKESLPRIIGELAAEMAGPGKSVMVHVEGTRSLDCRTPVQKMSGAFLDMAMHVGAPVVPVRFVGGLPADPLSERLEFPVGMGRQDVWLGRPILPETLASMPYKERKELVVSSINGIGPAHAVEQPFSGDPALEHAVESWASQTGADLPHSTILQVLMRSADLTPPIARLVQGAKLGHLALFDTTEDAWLRELAQRLYGPRGPTVG